jgi:hydrogenase nickel incorporation protein HypA/HybF
MHEWALAEAVIRTVERLRRENGGGRVLAVRLSIGELQRIELSIFREGLKNLLHGEAFGPEVFEFQIEPAAFRCHLCGREWLLAEEAGLGEEEKEAIHFLPETAHAYLRCPSCGSPDFSLERGRGVYVQSVDLEDGGD